LPERRRLEESLLPFFLKQIGTNMPTEVGYALREQNRLIVEREPAVTAVEITFERADDPLRTDCYLQGAHVPYVSVHALKMSPASADPPDRKYLDAIRAIALENDAQSVSDHLGFTRSGDRGAEMGHFALPPLTVTALDAVRRNIERIQNYFYPLHFYLENIAYLFRLDGTMSEAAFLRRVLESTGCGWLLDVTNVYANAVNFGFDARQFIAEVMPAASRLQIHLAGGFFDQQLERYIDSHSTSVPQAVWELYQEAVVLAGNRLDAVFIERDEDFPAESGWREEVRRARRIVNQVAASRSPNRELTV
jgi:uncharacterized protein (UPF0276 family)